MRNVAVILAFTSIRVWFASSIRWQSQYSNIHKLHKCLGLGVPKLPLVGQFQSLGAKPLHADHCDDLVGQNPSDCGAIMKLTTKKLTESLVLRFQFRSGRKDFLPVEPQGGLSFLFRLSEPRFA